MHLHVTGSSLHTRRRPVYASGSGTESPAKPLKKPKKAPKKPKPKKA